MLHKQVMTCEDKEKGRYAYVIESLRNSTVYLSRFLKRGERIVHYCDCFFRKCVDS